jgi:hypothetical protein
VTAHIERLNAQVEFVEQHWKLIRWVSEHPVAYIEAEAGTGSRYVVTGARLPNDTSDEGDILIAVRQPWQSAIIWGQWEMSHFDVATRLTQWPNQIPHLGDLAAVTKAINEVIEFLAD